MVRYKSEPLPTNAGVASKGIGLSYNTIKRKIVKKFSPKSHVPTSLQQSNIYTAPETSIPTLYERTPSFSEPKPSYTYQGDAIEEERPYQNYRFTDPNFSTPEALVPGATQFYPHHPNTYPVRYCTQGDTCSSAESPHPSIMKKSPYPEVRQVAFSGVGGLNPNRPSDFEAFNYQYAETYGIRQAPFNGIVAPPPSILKYDPDAYEIFEATQPFPYYVEETPNFGHLPCTYNNPAKTSEFLSPKTNAKMKASSDSKSRLSTSNGESEPLKDFPFIFVLPEALKPSLSKYSASQKKREIREEEPTSSSSSEGTSSSPSSPRKRRGAKSESPTTSSSPENTSASTELFTPHKCPTTSTQAHLAQKQNRDIFSELPFMNLDESNEKYISSLFKDPAFKNMDSEKGQSILTSSSFYSEKIIFPTIFPLSPISEVPTSSSDPKLKRPSIDSLAARGEAMSHFYRCPSRDKEIVYALPSNETTKPPSSNVYLTTSEELEGNNLYVVKSEDKLPQYFAEEKSPLYALNSKDILQSSSSSNSSLDSFPEQKRIRPVQSKKLRQKYKFSGSSQQNTTSDSAKSLTKLHLPPLHSTQEVRHYNGRKSFQKSTRNSAKKLDLPKSSTEQSTTRSRKISDSSKRMPLESQSSSYNSKYQGPTIQSLAASYVVKRNDTVVSKEPKQLGYHPKDRKLSSGYAKDDFQELSVLAQVTSSSEEESSDKERRPKYYGDLRLRQNYPRLKSYPDSKKEMAPLLNEAQRDFPESSAKGSFILLTKTTSQDPLSSSSIRYFKKMPIPLGSSLSLQKKQLVASDRPLPAISLKKLGGRPFSETVNSKREGLYKNSLSKDQIYYFKENFVKPEVDHASKHSAVKIRKEETTSHTPSEYSYKRHPAREEFKERIRMAEVCPLVKRKSFATDNRNVNLRKCTPRFLGQIGLSSKSSLEISHTPPLRHHLGAAHQLKPTRSQIETARQRVPRFSDRKYALRPRGILLDSTIREESEFSFDDIIYQKELQHEARERAYLDQASSIRKGLGERYYGRSYPDDKSIQGLEHSGTNERESKYGQYSKIYAKKYNVFPKANQMEEYPTQGLPSYIGSRELSKSLIFPSQRQASSETTTKELRFSSNHRVLPGSSKLLGSYQRKYNGATSNFHKYDAADIKARYMGSGYGAFSKAKPSSTTHNIYMPSEEITSEWEKQHENPYSNMVEDKEDSYKSIDSCCENHEHSYKMLDSSYINADSSYQNKDSNFKIVESSFKNVESSFKNAEYSIKSTEEGLKRDGPRLIEQEVKKTREPTLKATEDKLEENDLQEDSLDMALSQIPFHLFPCFNATMPVVPGNLLFQIRNSKMSRLKNSHSSEKNKKVRRSQNAAAKERTQAPEETCQEPPRMLCPICSPSCLPMSAPPGQIVLDFPEQMICPEPPFSPPNPQICCSPCSSICAPTFRPVPCPAMCNFACPPPNQSQDDKLPKLLQALKVFCGRQTTKGKPQNLNDCLKNPSLFSQLTKKPFQIKLILKDNAGKKQAAPQLVFVNKPDSKSPR